MLTTAQKVKKLRPLIGVKKLKECEETLLRDTVHKLDFGQVAGFNDTQMAVIDGLLETHFGAKNVA